jgi:hypothetical protein
MYERGILFLKDKHRLLVLKQDHDKKLPYCFSYDANEVYCDDFGEIRCMKCMEDVRYQFDKESFGTMYCIHCDKAKGNFRRIGYGTYIKEK